MGRAKRHNGPELCAGGSLHRSGVLRPLGRTTDDHTAVRHGGTDGSGRRPGAPRSAQIRRRSRIQLSLSQGPRNDHAVGYFPWTLYLGLPISISPMVVVLPCAALRCLARRVREHYGG